MLVYGLFAWFTINSCFSKRFGYTTCREKPPLVAKIAVFVVLPCLSLFTTGVNGEHPLCAVVSKTTFRARKEGHLVFTIKVTFFYVIRPFGIGYYKENHTEIRDDSR